MRVEMKSEEIKDSAMGVNNKPDSQCKDSSIENTSTASTSWSTIDNNESNSISAEQIFSISKEKMAVKQVDFGVFTTDASVSQETHSKSDDCEVTKSESSSPKSQECKASSETHLYHTFTLAASELEEALKAEESDVCTTDNVCIAEQDSDNAVASTSQLNSNKSHLAKISSEESLSAAEESKSTFNIEDSKSHRQNVHYSSESSDYETDESSDSSDCDEFFDSLRKNVTPAKLPVLKTKGELTAEDLPPVEDLHITVNSTELLKIGFILHWVVAEERKEFLVIVESDGNSNPLDDDSVLFLASDKPLGKVHDVFGNVSKPKYVVRFNKAEDIFNKGVTPGQTVYYSPTNGELTHYVLVDVLKNQKGSDASWKDNNEPPDDEIDYSDDEQEKLAKQKRRAKTRGKERNWNDGEVEDITPNKIERRNAAYSEKRAFKRPSRNMFQSPSSDPSSSPRPYSPRILGPAPLPMTNFDSSGMVRNATSPQTFGITSSNSSPFQPFLQRNASSPQPFGPFPHSNVPSPQSFQPPQHRNVPSPQPFGPSQHRNVPSPQSFRLFPHSSVSSYQPFTVPPTYVLASPNPAASHPTCVQLNPSSLMAAPQNNVPLQQQMLLQSQQPIPSFLSHPPPNYNSRQNSRTFLRQHQSFTPPIFGSLPAARPTVQNTFNQSSHNQIIFSSGTNAPHIGLSGDLNMSHSTNIVPMDSNGHRGQSYGMVPSNTANSFRFPPRNMQQNNLHSPVSEAVYASIQSGAVTPPPRPTNPFVPCQTPPVLLDQPGLSMLSNSPFSPSQTPPPLSNQQNLSFFSGVHPPVSPNQTPTSPVHFYTLSAPGNPMSAQNHRPY